MKTATKTKSVWFCSDCGHKAPKWLGQCPSCKVWNSFHEEVEIPSKARRFEAGQPNNKPLPLRLIGTKEIPRTKTHMPEIDRLLGGGIVPGSLFLVGGDPGIGKSTLLLQISSSLADQGKKVLYVCGEESQEQTALRAKRLSITSENLLLFCETNYSAIKAEIESLQPDIVIVDSIQIVYKSEISSSPGSVSQIRETTTDLMHVAKGRGISIFLIGHVTKAGELAGPRVLEHLVDTVLYFEGDKQHNYRLIRVVKNRFGSTDEVGVFQMTEEGLSQVPNPSQIFLEERRRGLVGSVIIPTIEGSRAILVEVQALVTDTAFSTPSRRCTGIDSNRLALLLAVLEKRMGYPLFQCDVFVSIAGGIKTMEPAVDLGILLAIASSLRNKPVDPDAVVVGEVGLGGEIRSCPRIEGRLKEAIHMGFSRALIPKRNEKTLAKTTHSIQTQGVELVEEAIHALIV